MMWNIEKFSSKQMYPYLSLDERKVAEFYHNIDGRQYLVWLNDLFSFDTFFRVDPSTPKWPKWLKWRSEATVFDEKSVVFHNFCDLIS